MSVNSRRPLRRTLANIMVAEHSIGYYESLDFNAPMTGTTADQIVTTFATADPIQILDVGCGWAELLLRLLTACPTARGHGIDHDAVLIARATRNAATRSLSDRVTFSADIADAQPSDIVVCVGSEHVFGSFNDALSGLRDIVRPGGRLLLGTSIWEQSPTPEQVETYGDLPVLRDLIAGATALGWRPLGLTLASAHDWDHFEFGFLADWETMIMSTSDPTESDQARQAADEHRDNYLDRRGILGFVYVTLGRPISARFDARNSDRSAPGARRRAGLSM